MIIYSKDNDIKNQLKSELEDLNLYKKSYNKKIELYEIFIKNSYNFENADIKLDELKNKIKKVDDLLNFINEAEKNFEVIDAEKIDQYNKDCEELKNTYINDSIADEEITVNCLKKVFSDFNKIEKETKEENNYSSSDKLDTDSNILSEGNSKIQNNDTLIISETQGIVKLPYRVEEVEEILSNTDDKYKDENDVIEKVFTRQISEYKMQFASRYNETIKLAREREKCSLIDSISLAMEMMRKRFLHPAIISACRTLEDLNVYLDCLDKNEIDDFKIFKIRYEVHPMNVKNKKKVQGRHCMEV